MISGDKLFLFVDFKMSARRKNKMVSTSSTNDISEATVDIEKDNNKTSKPKTPRATNSKATEQSLDGAAKQEQPKNIVQEKINDKLYKTVPISAFITEAIVTRVKNTVGVICRKCGSDNVYSESRQLRSGDEAASILYACLNCNHKWRVG